MIKVIDYGILYEAWHEIGGDVAGVDWKKFIEIVRQKELDKIENQIINEVLDEMKKQS